MRNRNLDAIKSALSFVVNSDDKGDRNTGELTGEGLGKSLQMRICAWSRKPLSVFRRIEGSNSSPSAFSRNRMVMRFLGILVVRDYGRSQI